jgi:anti-sigma-K factor RskA
MIWTQQDTTDVFTRQMERLFQMLGVVNALDKQVREQREHNNSSLRKTFKSFEVVLSRFNHNRAIRSLTVASNINDQSLCSADRSYRMVWNIHVFIRYEFFTYGTVSLLFTHGLFLIKTCTTTKLSITWLAQDSNISLWTLRNWHTVTTRLLTPMCYTIFTTFVTAFTNWCESAPWFQGSTLNSDSHTITDRYFYIMDCQY